MSGVNKVIIIGNLGSDPEIREIPGGGKCCQLKYCNVRIMER